jgi:intein/homing endonuclease
MSQAELRILAYYSKDPVFLEAFAQGLDLHARTASDLFGVTYDEVMGDKKLPGDDPNRKDYRGRVKALNFGLIYGLTKVGLARRLGVSENSAQELIDMYFSKYTRVRDWLDKAAKSSVVKRYSTTISGRRRYFKLPEPSDPNFNRMKGSVERRGKNTPIQGCLTSSSNIKGLGFINNLVGKEVLVSTGVLNDQINKAVGVYSGKKRVYELKLDNGVKLGITLDHKIPVITDRGIKLKELGKIDLKNDMFVIPLYKCDGKITNLSGYKYEKGHWRETYVSYKYPTKVDSRLSFVLGCLLGDGNYSAHNNFHFVCTMSESELFHKYNKFIYELFGYNPVVTEVNKKNSILLTSQVSSVVLRGFLKYIGLEYVINRDKKIPEWIFSETIKNKGSFLNGLFSTDGGVTKQSGPNFTTTSESLANGVHQILFSLGINSNLKEYLNEYGKVWRIQIPKRFIDAFINLIGFSVVGKQNDLYVELDTFSGKDHSRVPKFISEIIYKEFSSNSKIYNLSYSDKCHLRRFKYGSCSFTSWRKFYNIMRDCKSKKTLSVFLNYDFCKAISLQEFGEENTYDLSCISDPHFFVANGVLVHNSNADTIKQAMVYAVERLEPYDARLLSVVHDEVIVEVKNGQVEEVKPVVEKAVIDGFAEFFDPNVVEMKADADVADHWVKD